MKVKKTIIILVIITIIILVYARFIGTKPLRVNEYKIVSPRITENLYGLKIIHLTDIHYGRIVKEEELEEIVSKINNLNPDMIIITGDLLDRDRTLNSEQREQLVTILNKFKSNLGNYIISGNHDLVHPYYYDLVEKTNFKNIDDSFELVYHQSSVPLAIVGLSSNILNTTSIEDKLNDFLVFKEENETSYNILLLHEPDFIDQVNLSNFDIAFAGHSHYGQVRLPLIGPLILPPKAQKYHDQFYLIGDFPLYISGGVGTSTVDFRLFNHPSINLYRLTSK